MKTLLLHASSFKTFWAHYFVHQDPDFISKLSELGYRLALSNQKVKPVKCDRIIFSEAYSVGMHYFRLRSKVKQFGKLLLGRSQINLYRELVASGMLGKLVLIVFETHIHLPEHASPKLFSMFPKVFTTDDSLVDGKHIFKFCYPQPVKWPEIKPVAFNKKKLLVSISSRKYCRHPLELYSQRHNDIKYFSEKIPEDFDFYGFGWDNPQALSQSLFQSKRPVCKSYKGIANSKADVFPRYRFALCYENANIPGNIDEKIFDCMRSDCVPIFLGAPNIKDYVDKDAFIDRRDFVNEDELRRFLNDMTEQKYNRYREAIKSYLSGSRFAQFLSPALAETIVRGLESAP